MAQSSSGEDNFMLERAITSLAVLKVNRDRSKSYIDYFVPFVTESIRASNQSVVSLPDLQQNIRDTFGLSIPQHTLKLLLNRIYRVGYLHFKNGIYERGEKLDTLPNIASVRDDTLRKYESLINKLVNFCDKKYNVHWDKSQAESAFLAYLEDHSIAILTASLGQTLLLGPEQPVKHAGFLVRSFIVDIYESDPDGFDFLEEIVKGRMLANLLYFPDIVQVAQRVRNITLCLDTKFVLRLLGMAGPYFQAPCQELIELFKNERAKFIILDTTMSEIYRVLDAAKYALSNRRRMKRAYGEITDYFISQNRKPSDVELIISKLPSSLEELKINIAERPPYTNPLGLDEKKFSELLLKEVGYQNDDALQHDLDAVTSIYRLRNGNSCRAFETCKAIFVTTNSSLARASALFFRQEFTGYVVPLCTTDDVLATVMWVKTPLAFPDLPKKRIIADCYAALNPSDALWKLYLEEIDTLQTSGDIKEDDYALLRFSTEARSALMMVTRGATEAFVEGTVAMVLEKAKEAARAPVVVELQEEREKLQYVSGELEDVSSKLQDTQGKLKQSNQQISQRSDQYLSSLTRIKQNLDTRAVRYAKKLVWFSAAVVVAYWIVMAILIAIIGWNTIEPWTYILGGVIFIIGYLYFAITLSELSPLNFYDKITERQKVKYYAETGFDRIEYEHLTQNVS